MPTSAFSRCEKEHSTDAPKKWCRNTQTRFSRLVAKWYDDSFGVQLAHVEPTLNGLTMFLSFSCSEYSLGDMVTDYTLA